MGRPSTFTEELGEEIVARYVRGRTLTDISRDDDMPELSTIYRWKERFPAFGDALDHARGAHADSLAGQIIDIADTELDPQKARNRIEARKWLAAKFRPDRFGERLDLNVNGTISVAAALAEARSRARPISDLAEPVECQVIDLPCVSLPGPADAQSSDPVSDQLEPAEPAPAGPSIFD